MTTGAALLQVCIAKKVCKKHWGAPAPATNSDTAERDDKRRADEERATRERERLERERRFWNEQLQPALLSRIAEKAAHQKKFTRPLMITVLEALTRQESLEALYGPLVKLTPDRFPGALLVALALRASWSEAQLVAFAREVRVDVKALRRQLKTAPTRDEAAAIPE